MEQLASLWALWQVPHPRHILKHMFLPCARTQHSSYEQARPVPIMGA